MKSFKNFNEAVKGQDTESRKEGAKERAVDKKSGKIRKNTLDPKDYATQQKKSIEWHDKRTKGRYTPGQVSDVHEVAPPGWGHTKAEKEKTDPSKPKSKIGGTAAAFKRALDRGDFKGLPGSKTKKEKTADMFKLMGSMKKKGDKPHYKPGTDEKYKKYQEEDAQYGYDKKGRSLNPKDIKKRSKKSVIPSREDPDNKPAIEDWVSHHSMGPTESLSHKDSKKLAKASVLSSSDDPKDQDRARARQTEIDYKDLLRQRKKGKVGVGKSMREGKSWKQWKTAAKEALGKKTPKHDYGKDAGAEAAKRLRKKDHEKGNFLDPDD